ncbi:MAG: SAM-dependent methyltransferase [Burkholderiales bacterium PBB4]|nr:MAG: SAM-dependent methyltransferase [Burkholderiales bacterium PBB4]
MTSKDPLPFSAAADRNKHPILQVLQGLLPAQGRALEIASGTGQHVAWFASHLPGWTWQPSDVHTELHPAIAAHAAALNAHKVLPACVLNVLQKPWLHSNARFDAIYCANMLHISPWATTAALMQGSAAHLVADGVLITYGPYLEDGVPTAESNLAFDDSLRAQNPDWGLRHLNDVAQQAAGAGLQLVQRLALPAHNLLLVWRRAMPAEACATSV